jgi:hypothetical protein
MKIKKSLRTITLLLVGFAAGVYAGEWRTKRVEREGLKRTETLLAAHEAYLSYRLGTYENAKRLLLQNVRLLDEMSRGSDRYVGGDSSATDAVISYVRLAKLEEKVGGDEDGYMREAVARCERLARWKVGCSENSLRDFTDKMDAYPMPAK